MASASRRKKERNGGWAFGNMGIFSERKIGIAGQAISDRDYRMDCLSWRLWDLVLRREEILEDGMGGGTGFRMNVEDLRTILPEDMTSLYEIELAMDMALEEMEALENREAFCRDGDRKDNDTDINTDIKTDINTDTVPGRVHPARKTAWRTYGKTVSRLAA